MLSLIKKLSELNAPSGNEKIVREAIIAEIEGHCEYRVDRLGNLIAFKKGAAAPKNKVMLAAHMDEVGFIITYIEDSGLLRFATVGGIDTRVVVGRRVHVGDKAVIGVIGTKPVHLTKSEEEGTMPEIEDLYIDIGAKDKEDALKYVALGDFAAFVSEYTEFGEGLIKAKALDDRAGCAVMIEMIKAQQPYDLYFAFNTQEEVGCRGAGSSTFSIEPDYAIVLEATTAADIAGVEKEKQVCELGLGPVISFMDHSTVYDRELYSWTFETAKEKNIKCQPKRMVAGGNDASVIHKSRAGVRTLAVSMPCRYLHSESCVLNIEDINETLKLSQAMAERFAQA